MNNTKNIHFKILLLSLISVLPLQNATAALFFTDQFNYPNGDNLGVSGPWVPGTSGAGNNATQIKVTTAAAQTSPGGYASAAFNGVAVSPSGSARATAALFNGPSGITNTDGSVVYASFLLNVQVLPAANTRVAYLHDVTSSGGAVEVWINSMGQIGVRKKTGSPVFATTIATNTTHLVVMRYTFQAGNDPVALWVDPGSSDYGSASAPTPAAAITSVGSDNGSGGIKYFIVDCPGTSDSVYWIDEVRVGSTWGDVTPSTGSVNQPSVPVITQTLFSPQGMILRGSNGPSSSTYQVIATTNITLPVSNWPSIAAHSFDLSGNFDSTNPVTLGLKQQFFRLIVGGTNSPVTTAPSITNQPQSLTVGVGATASFLVGATGDAPLTYFWSFNTNTSVGGNSSTLALVNVQTNNAGSYRVIVSNAVGVVTSAVATLTVLSSPVITVQPQSQSVAVSNDATFTVTATGTAPLTYRWFFNTNASVGVDSNVFTLLNAQTNNAGTYSVIVTNNYGAVTSAFATLTIGAAVTNNAQFNLMGFGEGTTGGGVLAENNSAYRKVTTPLEFANAVRSANKTANSVKVIEIMNDLDLGWNEIDPAVKSLDSTPFASALLPKLHPALLTSGVSVIYINPKGTGLTIFSANGATIRHATWSIKATSNIMVRNLKFDELWEWDEESAGGYDQNNWDFIDLSVGGGTVDHVWIDHCTFTKSYDGIADNKGGVSSVTYSWNKYMGDDGATNPNSFVWQQINSLESNKVVYPMYNFLRTHGFSTTNIVTILQGPDKTTAIGELSMKDVNTNASLTFHHQWYINCWDRLPRLAGGTAHNFNIYVDDTLVLAARRLRDAKYNAMSPTDRLTFDNNYSFKPPINGSISTEDGALLVEKSVYIDCNWPLRNNQTDPSNPIYTGKIKALDTIYQYDSTFVRGNSTDPGNPLGPFQAPIKPFSWNTNGVTPNGQLPYTYTMDDPSQLQSIVTSPTIGAGSGVLTWNKTNWMKTSY